ncbi:hypothetical protein [Nodularia sp. UHCC 0506]|uniref:COG1470 family protein n=1 Tax=Nodularia sp. UHCC 0506 TaxID=3110243 RepID=UPI002B2159A9|nr:hypothetical protein [Nodularia sp. UHCC 0506]MEA5514599.1 hypothetical protein [Nodularia sp. UHCC 0506]
MTTTNAKSGLNMVEVLMLPPQQRKLVQWMMKRSPDGITLAEAALKIDLNQQATLDLLDELVAQNFVQEVLTSDIDEVKYQINLVAKRGIQQQNLSKSLAPGNPLAIIFNPSGDYAVQAGSRFEISGTVSNKGAESALIDVFIDDLSPQLIQWCDTPRQRLALNPDSMGEILFQFQVPVTAIPSTYNYMIVVDAPEHYPEDTPIRHQSQLQILPAIETIVKVSDPTFTLLPSTSSRSPAPIPPGGILQVSVNVHNRSDRVDRFRLSCLDFDESWFSIRYPEGLQTVGLIIPNMGLNLNPGEKGEITLSFNPPISAIAGLYYPTIRLYSANNPDLALLDVVYLEILPSYQLNAELITIFGRIKRKNGIFEIKFTNQGNTAREIICRTIPADEDKLCTYTISPELLRLIPGEKANAQVTVTPIKWWHRPIFGAGRLLNFRIELEDQQQLPLPYNSLPGTLVWEPRPWWQFLLLLLTGLGTLAAIAFLIWWLLRPPAPPKIRQFNSPDTTYKQANNDFIRLSWEINNPRTLQSLSLSGVFADGTTAIPPIVYEFNGKIPNELQQFCQMGKVLTCANVPTDARQPGNYNFELHAFSRRNSDQAADVMKTNTIQIIPVPPVPQPEILEFFSTKPIYQQVADISSDIPYIIPCNNTERIDARTSLEPICLNWKINNLEQIRELNLIGRSPEGIVTHSLKRYDFNQGISPELKPRCKQQQNQLNCSNVLVQNPGTGNYIFELQVIPKTAPEKIIISQKTDIIAVDFLPSKILQFQVNNQELTKYPILIDPTKSSQSINLSWQVEGSRNMKVELLPVPGNVPPIGSIVYPISRQPGIETITLQVTNPAGETISRSVIIETFLPPVQLPPESQTPQIPGLMTPNSVQPPVSTEPGSSTPSSSSPSAPTPASPTPSQPGQLSPLELPPGFD